MLYALLHTVVNILLRFLEHILSNLVIVTTLQH